MNSLKIAFVSFCLAFSACTIISAPPPNYIPFGTNQDTPSDQDAVVVTEAVQHMNRDSELHALVVGHTDDVGSDEYNAELSLRRAGNIRNQMMAEGIADGRIQWAARGESEPVAGGDTAESRALNRRVEIFYFYPAQGTAERQYGFTLTFGQ